MRALAGNRADAAAPGRIPLPRVIAAPSTRPPAERGTEDRPQPAAAAPPVGVSGARPRFGLPLPVGQIAAWQVSLTLIGMTVGRPWAVAGPAIGCAAGLLALTVLRVRHRWLYQWAWRFARFLVRARRRHLPREDGPRAVLHLFAPDAMVTSIRLDEGDAAVVSRRCGATAVLRPLAGADPVGTPPAPGVPVAEGVVVQLVFHGVAGGRRGPLAWLAVQAVRTPDRSEEDELIRVLHAAVRRVRDSLAERGIGLAGLDRTELLHSVASLAHASEDRGEVRERWRSWRCGPVVQAAFRLRGWAGLPGAAANRLLQRLLTANTGGVVTVAVRGEPDAATLRVAASSVERLERSVRRLGALAAEPGVRLDRMDGEHAAGVAAVLPLGALH